MNKWRKLKNLSKKQRIKLLLGILSIVLLVSSLILEIYTRKGDEKVLQLGKELQAETASEKEGNVEDVSEMEMQTEEEAPESEASEPESEQMPSVKEQRQRYDEELTAYEEQFTADIIGEEEDIQYLLDTEEKRQQFLKTIADFAYSTWGEIDIDRVKIGALVTEDTEELCYQIQIVTELETMPCEIRYDKAHGTFGLY